MAVSAKKIAEAPQQKSLVVEMAAKYHVDPDKFLTTLKATAFKQAGKDISNEELMSLLVICQEYNLNPFLKQIYAFKQGGSIVPIVGVDGYIRIVNENPQADGWSYTIADTLVSVDGVNFDLPEWVECIMHRKDREHPTIARVYMAESFRKTGPWQQYPRLMLENRAFIRAARFAFGFTGIYSEDDAERMAESPYIEAEVVESAPQTPAETVTEPVSEDNPPDPKFLAEMDKASA